MEKKHNIFWFIIDSVRTTKSELDDRDRLDIMDKFAKDSIEFTNCFTSAPSTKLAAGAMFSGLPTVYTSRHFNDWKFKPSEISTISTLVKEYNYSPFLMHDTRGGRELFQYLIPPFPASYLPSSYRLSDYVWHNIDLTVIFKHILAHKDLANPFIFVVWYDCRRDLKTSFHVSEAIDEIKAQGYYDNSIIIMNSDHGYPDPRSKINEEFFKNLGHDMIVTDDNIKTPLFIKYPGSPVNKKIDNIVGHIDIIPTIFDILNIPRKEVNIRFKGQSLLPVINGFEKSNNRIIRTDCRLVMDKSKMISLRSKNYKYVFYGDENFEALYNMVSDPEEINNLLGQPGNYEKELDRFRTLLSEYERDIYSYHFDELKMRAQKSFKPLKKKFIEREIEVLVVSSAPKELVRILANLVKDNFNCSRFDFITDSNQKMDDLNVNHIFNLNDFSHENITKLNLRQYSLVIYLTENSERVFLKNEIFSAIKSIPSKHSILMNYNFELFNYFVSKHFSSATVKLFFDWERKGFFYKQEPSYFFKSLWFLIKFVFSKIFTADKNLGDVKAAKEILEFRNHHLKQNKQGLNKMTDEQLGYEFERIKTRED